MDVGHDILDRQRQNADRLNGVRARRMGLLLRIDTWKRRAKARRSSGSTGTDPALERTLRRLGKAERPAA